MSIWSILKARAEIMKKKRIVDFLEKFKPSKMISEICLPLATA